MTMQPVNDDFKRARRGGLLWIALAASLLVNAFAIGWWGMGCMGHDDMHRHPPGRAAQQRLAHAIGTIAPEYRERIRDLVAAQDTTVTQQGDQMAMLFTQIRVVLAAPQFDAAKLTAIHQQVDQHDRALKDSFSATVVKIAQALPDAERIKFFNAAFPADENNQAAAKK